MTAPGEQPGPLTLAEVRELLDAAGVGAAGLRITQERPGLVVITGPPGSRSAAFAALFNADLACSPYAGRDEYRRR